MQITTRYQQDRMSNNRSSALIQPILHCHLRFGVVLVVDTPYLIMWIPMALILTVVRSYKQTSITPEDTHQDYYLHTDATRDPFTALMTLLRAPNIPTKLVHIHRPINDTVEVNVNEKTREIPMKNEETSSIFQKALAASMTRNNTPPPPSTIV
jgi:hypothetical protein